MKIAKISINLNKSSKLYIYIFLVLLLSGVSALSTYYWQNKQIERLNKSIKQLQAQLSTKHSTGSTQTNVPASNATAMSEDGTPHDYVIPPVANGMVPVINHIPTKAPVVFLTIDDGITQNPADVQLMTKDNVKATLFLVHRFIQNDPSFFSNIGQATGSLIEDHTYDHYLQTVLSYDQQKQDICSNADAFVTWFGRRPVIYRPPGGAYDTDSQRAAAACGMQALVLWDVTVNNGSLQFQTGHSLQPGDIVLMHFRTTFNEDLTAFVNAMKASGLKTDLLENWLPQD